MKTATGIELSKALELLAVDFPQSAIKERTGSGGKLSSISPAYEIERLNDVFGLCGFGWRYSFTDFKEYPGEGKISLIVVAKVTLEYLVVSGGDDDVSSLTKFSNPVTAIGQGTVHQGMSIGDAHKSAVTDGLTKAASMIGVGQSVFKGEQSHDSKPQAQPKPTRQEKQTAAAKKADKEAKPVLGEPVNEDGFRGNPEFTQFESDTVEIPAKFKSAPKSGKSLIYTISGEDIIFPIGHVESHSDDAVRVTEWIAGKKTEDGKLDESLCKPVSYDPEDYENQDIPR